MTKEYDKFRDALERVLSVTHSEIKNLEAEDKERRNYVMKKRGPKKKKPSVSGRAKDAKD
jgi:hypothetical protein